MPSELPQILVQPTCSASGDCWCLCYALFLPHISPQANMKNGHNDFTLHWPIHYNRQSTPNPMRPLESEPNIFQPKEQTFTSLWPWTSCSYPPWCHLWKTVTVICLHPRLFWGLNDRMFEKMPSKLKIMIKSNLYVRNFLSNGWLLASEIYFKHQTRLVERK